ncbi:PspA/IM30 family protein [Robertkochia sediminum]|uniref:PspA/IM30 family protein n=1 Tax=Robertkochia sediminum TaxID=2785326 RepID=UPI00193324F6|nr:PspA/IM30 family protein [Robertkochia sediminum]MBL7471182.1 PspA/IM30 family protein [Robertkochia sediminum]
MNIFKRLFKIGQAEANSAIDHMEDPIKMTEQGLRDLQEDLNKNMEALAQVKALAIRAKNDKDTYLEKKDDYHNKAVLILKKGASGEMEKEEADRLAKQALIKKEEAQSQADRSGNEAVKFNDNVAQLERNIQTIKSNISQWENELRTLKARVKVSNATKSLNKQMAEIDSSSTVSMLERMKEKVAQEEALAEAYGDIANATTSIDEELDKAANSTEANADGELDKLKEQLGMNDTK